MSNKMPVAFIAHGSPMNINADNEFTQSLVKLSIEIPKPEAILVISAHWLTRGTRITGNEYPSQVFDFYGFPSELYQVQYHPKGNSSLADNIAQTIGIEIDMQRGHDHAAWSVLKHIYPEGDIPVLSMSLDAEKPVEWHLQMGSKLEFLREMGVFIIGSGNVVHNLREADFMNTYGEAFPWSLDFEEDVANAVNRLDIQGLLDKGVAGSQAVPTNEHYLPMLYILGLLTQKPEIFHRSIQNASVSMLSFVGK